MSPKRKFILSKIKQTAALTGQKSQPTCKCRNGGTVQLQTKVHKCFSDGIVPCIPYFRFIPYEWVPFLNIVFYCALDFTDIKVVHITPSVDTTRGEVSANLCLWSGQYLHLMHWLTDKMLHQLSCNIQLIWYRQGLHACGRDQWWGRNAALPEHLPQTIPNLTLFLTVHVVPTGK